MNLSTIAKEAPELLLEQILTLQKIVTNHKLKKGEDDNYRTFKKILDAMLFSWQFMQDMKGTADKINLLSFENKMLREYLARVEEELLTYRVVEKQLLKGTIEDVMKRAQDNINKITKAEG